ncbi:class I SAM-dependent methyltransferase [Roseomonas stagni]|uniref:Class I SAM-dependent methyltransferase n=1 Tax=Falsiroseomonas algicola TaxID=2716930 RepID=A0A6M1LSR6_9PROT|nr:DUF6492 family protein [Falsiroseomonas algicola]NGM22624.1 class I SAM-dependent methyltransferase [Falsiroseomonas algicola]
MSIAADLLPPDTAIDYVVVSFVGDLPLLRLQARSFARFHLPDDIGRIIVVNNDNDSTSFDQRFEAEVRPVYGDLAGKVEVVRADSLLPGITQSRRGWRRQQALKLAACRLVQAPVSVSIDSKNHLIRPTGKAIYRTPEGRLIVPGRKRWSVPDACLSYFGVPEESWPADVSNIVTPYPLVTAQVLSLLEELERRGETLATLFETKGQFFEFALYYAWLVAQGREGIYDLSAPIIATGLWPHKFPDPERPLRRLVAQTGLPHLHWLAIHRKTQEVHPALKEVVTGLWQGFGLIGSTEEGIAILTAGGMPAAEAAETDDAAEEAPDGDGPDQAGTAEAAAGGAAEAVAETQAPPEPRIDPVDALLIPGFRTGRETLDILKVFAGLTGPRVLDLGCYRGGSTLVMALLGKHVEALIEGRFWPDRLAPILEPRGMRALNLPYDEYEPEAPLDGIWASHVIQNQRNPGLFLDRCRRHLKDDGWLAVVVPPLRSRITAGKVNPGWNVGALMYALLAAGFDLTRGHFVTHGFNVVAFVPKATRVLERHADAFADPSLWPFKLDSRRGFEGDIRHCNWPQEFRDRMATGLSELALEGPEAALAEARRLATIWV